MEIFSNSVRTSIPESDFFGEIEAESVVGKGVYCIKERKHAGGVHARVELVVGSSDDGDIEVVPGVNLIRAIEKLVSSGIVFLLGHMVLHLLEINSRNPGISINDGEKDRIEVDSCRLEEILLQVLSTP